MAIERFSPEYLRYIDSEEWRRRRALKLLLGGGISGSVYCDTCGRAMSVTIANVHHKNYERMGRELMSDLAILCRRCHDLEKEIAAVSAGGDAMQMSPELVSTLALIDKRIGLPTVPRRLSVAQASGVAGVESIGELVAKINRKREEMGIVEKDTGP